MNAPLHHLAERMLAQLIESLGLDTFRQLADAACRRRVADDLEAARERRLIDRDEHNRERYVESRDAAYD